MKLKPAWVTKHVFWLNKAGQLRLVRPVNCQVGRTVRGEPWDGRSACGTGDVFCPVGFFEELDRYLPPLTREVKVVEPLADGREYVADAYVIEPDEVLDSRAWVAYQCAGGQCSLSLCNAAKGSALDMIAGGCVDAAIQAVVQSCCPRHRPSAERLREVPQLEIRRRRKP